MKKIILLSNASSVHTIRWANSLSNTFELILISQHEPISELKPNIKFYKLRHTGNLGYFANIRFFRAIVAMEKPALIHAHYASGYGTLAAFSGHPFILSVWGSDVYDFPEKNIFNKFLLKYNLSKAQHIFSTSHCMLKRTSVFTKKAIAVLPFGVDTKKITPTPTQKSINGKKNITIGTIKVLSPKYGIEYLIEGFHRAKLQHKQLNLKLNIIGDGPSRHDLERKVSNLGLDDSVSFKGWIDNNDICDELNKIDIFVVPSILDSESFGVAAVEACAAGVPTIVSDVGGLPEVVINNTTGYVVPKADAQAIAERIEFLIANPGEYSAISSRAREHVLSKYNWADNVEEMVKHYFRIIREDKCISPL